MEYLVLLIPLSLPALGFFIGFRVFRGHLGAAVTGAALAGLLTGAFLGSASAAMATAVSAEEALLRGGLIGLAAGAGIGVLLAGALRLIRRRRTEFTNGGTEET